MSSYSSVSSLSESVNESVDDGVPSLAWLTAIRKSIPHHAIARESFPVAALRSVLSSDMASLEHSAEDDDWFASQFLDREPPAPLSTYSVLSSSSTSNNSTSSNTSSSSATESAASGNALDDRSWDDSEDSRSASRSSSQFQSEYDDDRKEATVNSPSAGGNGPNRYSFFARLKLRSQLSKLQKLKKEALQNLRIREQELQKIKQSEISLKSQAKTEIRSLRDWKGPRDQFRLARDLFHGKWMRLCLQKGFVLQQLKTVHHVLSTVETLENPASADDLLAADLKMLSISESMECSDRFLQWEEAIESWDARVIALQRSYGIAIRTFLGRAVSPDSHERRSEVRRLVKAFRLPRLNTGATQTSAPMCTRPAFASILLDELCDFHIQSVFDRLMLDKRSEESRILLRFMEKVEGAVVARCSTTCALHPFHRASFVDESVEPTGDSPDPFRHEILLSESAGSQANGDLHAHLDSPSAERSAYSSSAGRHHSLPPTECTCMFPLSHVYLFATEFAGHLVSRYRAYSAASQSAIRFLSHRLSFSLSHKSFFARGTRDVEYCSLQSAFLRAKFEPSALTSCRTGVAMLSARDVEFPDAVAELENLNIMLSPIDMQLCVVAAARAIYSSGKVRESDGADVFFPALVGVVKDSILFAPWASVEYVHASLLFRSSEDHWHHDNDDDGDDERDKNGDVHAGLCEYYWVAFESALVQAFSEYESKLRRPGSQEESKSPSLFSAACKADEGSIVHDEAQCANPLVRDDPSL
eukprot:ANDGO_03923.mRNA.1 hypothetical protein